MKKYNIKNFYKGWFIGDFEPTLVKTKDFEVAIQFHEKGFIDDEHVHLQAEEYTVIIKGKILLNDEIFTEGDIILIERGEYIKATMLEDTTFLVVKIPSIKNDKILKKLKRVFIEVGANTGMDSIKTAKTNPDLIFYAFEPFPDVFSQLVLNAKTLSNYYPINKAVSDFNGTASFNINTASTSFDFGACSLLPLSENVHQNWPGRTLHKTLYNIPVEVIRLDTFIEQNNIDQIYFLLVDTQGCDLKVLEGLGDKISIVRAGQVEAANKPDVLYKNQNTKEETIKFLQDHDFEITSMWYNDEFQNEVNITFSNKRIKQ